MKRRNLRRLAAYLEVTPISFFCVVATVMNLTEIKKLKVTNMFKSHVRKYVYPFFVLFPLAILSAPVVADDLVYSLSDDRSGASALDGATFWGDVYIFFANTTPDTEIKEVEFFIDSTSSGKDNKAPYDLVGGNENQAHPYDTEELEDGNHFIEVRMTLNDDTTSTFSANFSVDNASAPLDPGDGLRVSNVRMDFYSGELLLERRHLL